MIFGAALRPDGAPSEALRRRIACGLAAARAHPASPVLCSGGARGGGPSEAALMARMLTAEGVAPDRLILDEASATTRDNVQAAARVAAAGGHPFAVVCSDRYHLPRIRALMRLAGVPAMAGPVAGRPPLPHHLAMSLREAAALVHNLVVLAGGPGRPWRRASPSRPNLS